MFKKTLRTMVEGLRSPGVTNSAVYVSECVDEIKQELKSQNDKVKAQALSKLVYLRLTGVDIRWASFNIIEVMSMAQFRFKRVGYLAAEQVFDKDTDVILLCNNLLKKQLGSKDPYEIGLALSVLSNIVTPDLARDMLQDITTLMSKSRIPYVRQKATLIMYKLFLEYPEGLRLSFDDLKDRLSEKNVGVCGAAVNVICELSATNPRNYLPIAPVLFDLLINATNNWMLIKVVKLLARLVQEEPRLARKILAPLRDLIVKTQAKSVQYEALYAAACTIPFARKKNGEFSSNVPGVVEVVDRYLHEFVEDADQNLKFLGLVGMAKLLESHPGHVQEHTETIMSCLSDIDVTIKMQALHLVEGIVNADNLQLVCNQLADNLTLAPAGAYRDALAQKIVKVCSHNRYALVRDFAWYLRLLVNKVCRVDSSEHEEQTAAQLVSVVIRVPPVQQLAVEMLLPLLAAGAHADSTATAAGLAAGGADPAAPLVCLDAVVRAAAWVVAEYGDGGREDAEAAAKLRRIFGLLINARTRSLPAASQAVFVHSALQVLVRVLRIHRVLNAAATDPTGAMLADMRRLVDEFAVPLAGATDAANEVRARVHNLHGAAAAAAPREGDAAAAAAGGSDVALQRQLADRLAAFAAVRAAPVSAKAQGRVPVPEGLRMKKWISKPAKQRAIAARTRIMQQREGGGNGKPLRYSLDNLRLTVDGDGDSGKDGGSNSDTDGSGSDAGGGANDESSDEFAQFREDAGGDSDSSSSDGDVAAPATEAEKKKALFYIGGAKPANPGKKTKKKKKSKRSSKTPHGSAGSSPTMGDAVNLSDMLGGRDGGASAPITAAVILGSDDESDGDGGGGTAGGGAGGGGAAGLSSIDLSAPGADGLSFEALKQRHRTDAPPPAPAAAAGEEDKKNKQKKNKKSKKDKKKKEAKKKQQKRDAQDVQGDGGGGGGGAVDAAATRPKAPSVNLLDFSTDGVDSSGSAGGDTAAAAAATAGGGGGGGGADAILGLFGDAPAVGSGVRASVASDGGDGGGDVFRGLGEAAAAERGAEAAAVPAGRPEGGEEKTDKRKKDKKKKKNKEKKDSTKKKKSKQSSSSSSLAGAE